MAARAMAARTARYKAKTAAAAHFRGETATTRKASWSLQRLLLVQPLFMVLLFVQLSLLLQLDPKESVCLCRGGSYSCCS
jgi:hypothetical protein